MINWFGLKGEGKGLKRESLPFSVVSKLSCCTTEAVMWYFVTAFYVDNSECSDSFCHLKIITTLNTLIIK